MNTRDSRVIMFDTIISTYKNMQYDHGEVRYETIGFGEDMLKTHIDIKLAIESIKREEFINEIQELVQKYAR